VKGSLTLPESAIREANWTALDHWLERPAKPEDRAAILHVLRVHYDPYQATVALGDWGQEYELCLLMSDMSDDRDDYWRAEKGGKAVEP